MLHSPSLCLSTYSINNYPYNFTLVTNLSNSCLRKAYEDAQADGRLFHLKKKVKIEIKMAVQVEIKARHLIKPEKKTWTGTMELSELDMTFVNFFGRQVNIYNNNNNNKTSVVKTETLKASLAKVLVHFYPLTGRLRATATGGAGRLELQVDDDLASGVPFVEAEADSDVADLGDDLMEADVQGRLANLFCSKHDLHKPVEEWPLMIAQITHFRCGGVAVAVTLSHVIADGISAAHFFSEWSRIARGEPLEMKPIHNRTLLRAGELPRLIPKFIEQGVAVDQAPLPHTTFLQQGVDQPPLTQTTMEMLRVSKSQIEKLKQLAGHVINDRTYTRFEVLTAHVWRCINKARENGNKKVNTLAMTMDVRKRINPPLPQKFFGNAAILNVVTSESKDLISNPLSYACDNIRKSLNKVTNDTIWGYLYYLKSVIDLGAPLGAMTPEGILVNPDIIMVYRLSLSLNNIDFGWGNESYTTFDVKKMEGRVLVQPGQEDGSAIITICLQVNHMDKFKYHFFNQLP